MTPEEIRALVTRDLGPYLVIGHAYHSPLPADLAPWYCYIRDGGHCIAVVVVSEVQPGSDPLMALTPAPVRAVLRTGYTVRDHLIWCDIPYSKDVGVLVEAEDDEY